MSTIAEVKLQLQAANLEHVRAVIEPDDLMVLLDHLERTESELNRLHYASTATAEAPKDAPTEKPTKTKGKSK